MGRYSFTLSSLERARGDGGEGGVEGRVGAYLLMKMCMVWVLKITHCGRVGGEKFRAVKWKSGDV